MESNNKIKIGDYCLMCDFTVRELPHECEGCWMDTFVPEFNRLLREHLISESKEKDESDKS